jgi:hypothetical protein
LTQTLHTPFAGFRAFFVGQRQRGRGFLSEGVRTPLPDSRERNSARKKTRGERRKSCRLCGKTKKAAEFRRNARTRDGLSSWCAACHTEASRRWREKQRELVAEALEARHRRAEP